MKLPRMLLVAGLATLLAPAAANADSIVYIDQGNVWSATPDGARKVQLTTGGGWHSPTQADDGTIAAVQGAGPIQVMARDGRPIRTITTEMARSSNGGMFEARPTDLSFSPDGTKIAYSYYSFSCPPGSSCGAQRSTFYTDATTATPIETYGNQFGVSNPEWVTNSRTLVFGGYGRQVSIDDLGPGDYSHVPWMVPNGDMGDGEITRDGKRLAVTSDYGENTQISFFAVSGDIMNGAPPAYPEWACSMTNPDPNFADPTWAPDSVGIAWQSSKGIEVSRFTKFGPVRVRGAERPAALRHRLRARLGPRRPAGGRLHAARARPDPPADPGCPDQPAERHARAHEGDREGAAQGPRREGRRCPPPAR